MPLFMTRCVQSDLKDGSEVSDMLHSLALFLHGFQHVAGEEVAPVVHNQRVQQLVETTLDVRGWTLQQRDIAFQSQQLLKRIPRSEDDVQEKHFMDQYLQQNRTENLQCVEMGNVRETLRISSSSAIHLIHRTLNVRGQAL